MCSQLQSSPQVQNEVTGPDYAFRRLPPDSPQRPCGFPPTAVAEQTHQPADREAISSKPITRPQSPQSSLTVNGAMTVVGSFHHETAQHVKHCTPNRKYVKVSRVRQAHPPSKGRRDPHASHPPTYLHLMTQLHPQLQVVRQARFKSTERAAPWAVPLDQE